MDFDDPAAMRRLCVERLGPETGRQFAAMARRGFRLVAASQEAPAAGRSRLGGPALLEPGTAWPALEGVPLSLHAVLDTDALAAWLGDQLPTRPGLLNFFYLDPDVPYEEYRELDSSSPDAWRVIPADPTRAVTTTAPGPARHYPARPVHAVEVTMLPDSWDLQDDDLTYDEDQHWGAPSLILGEMDGLDGNTAGHHCAFGWPDTSYTVPVTSRDDDGPAVHLLQLAEDADLGWGWGDAGTIYFTVPAGAFAAGDFGKAEAIGRCC
ncbi:MULTISPECIES: YwqG family protein [unclassified Kitasatospora]|uniref:YwqG family protein n=1 Tax=unclassified Kitasatospora TaxID=2633591 RepID=UPI00340CCB62